MPLHSEHFDFNRLFKVSYADARSDFGLLYIAENAVYQGILPVGIIFKFQDFPSWNSKNANESIVLSKITAHQLWARVDSNEYQNVATKERRIAKQCSWDDMAQTNWLNNFWEAPDSIGSFVTIDGQLFVPEILSEEKSNE